MKRERIESLAVFLSIIFASSLFICLTPFAHQSWAFGQIAHASAAKSNSFPDFELPIPEDEGGRNYLGLSGSGNFKISQIKTKVLVIEAFSMYCPHCQKEAPHVNELYHAIEERPDLKDTIKIIGIGVANSPFEVNTFKEKYAISFPLFADKEMSVTKLLGVMKTPTFIGIKINNDGTCQDFYFKSGTLGEIEPFITEMVSHD